MVGPLQIDVVDTNYFSAVDVDDLAVDEIALQKEIVALVLKGRNRLGRAQFQCAGRSFQYFLRRHNREAGSRPEYNSSNLAAVRPRGHHNIFELAAQLSMRVGHRRAEKRR